MLTNYFRKIGAILPLVIILSYIYLIYLIFFLIPSVNSLEITPFENNEEEISDYRIFSHIIPTIILHYFLVIFLVSFYRTFATEPGKVPDYWHSMVLEELNDFDRELQRKNVKKYLSRSLDDIRSKENVEKNENPSILERKALSEAFPKKNDESFEIHQESQNISEIPLKLSNSLEKPLIISKIRSNLPLNLDEIRDLEDKFLKEKGYDRFCSHCQNFKPPRSHHCRECGYCVLKMDHHCPWVLNCIGFYNYKFFFNMILNGDICGLFITSNLLRVFSREIWEKNVEFEKIVVFSTVLGLLIMISTLVTAFLAFHVYLVGKGQTALENYDKKKGKFNYNMGFKQNFITIFGKNPFFWFLPIKNNDLENGVFFEKKPENTRK